MSVDKGTWFGNQKEIDNKIQNLDDDGNLTAHTAGEATSATTGFAAGTASVATTGGAIGTGATETLGGGAIGAGATSTLGGGAIGFSAGTTKGGAVGSLSASERGGACGGSAKTTEGFAGGLNSESTTGGAAGDGASATSGFSGGYYAVSAVDSIQLGAGTNTVAGSLQIYSNQLLNATGFIPPARYMVTKPAAANSTGTAGQIAYEAGFLYVCVATDTWQKATIATW